MIALGTLVIGGSLVGLGLYRDNKPEKNEYINWAIKGAGLMFLVTCSGLALRDLVEEEDRRYFKKHNIIYPRQNNSQKDL